MTRLRRGYGVAGEIRVTKAREFAVSPMFGSLDLCHCFDIRHSKFDILLSRWEIHESREL